MAGENVQQYFLRDQVTADYFCSFCTKKYAKGTSVTRLRGHLTGEAKTGATKCLGDVPQSVRDSLAIESSKTQKTATGYIPPPSYLPPEEAASAVNHSLDFGDQGWPHPNMTSTQNPAPDNSFAQFPNNDVSVEDSVATTTLVLPSNGSGANSYFGNQGPWGFLEQQHIFPLQNTTHLPLGETLEDMIGVTEAVMQPNETSSNPHQIVSKYSDNFPPFGQLINGFGNHESVQLGPQSGFQRPMRYEVMQDYAPVQSSYSNFEPGQTSGSIAVEEFPIGECMPLCLQDQTYEYTAEAAAFIETYTGTCSLLNADGIPDNYEKSLEDQNNEDTMVENESNLQHREIAGLMKGPILANETGASPIENVMTDEVDQNKLQICEGRVCLEVPSAEASSVQRTQRDGIVQSSNKRQRSTPDALPIVSLTKRLVGDAFGRNEEKIWSWLMDDQVLRVGIYGMGGVGKTTLMRHIQTRLEGEISFEVYWITVSQDFSIFKLQNLIAKQIGLSFSDEEDEVKRAKYLAQEIQAKRKCVLILDDLWNYFDVDEVGIPVAVNICKLVLTTRFLKVCREMDCIEGNTIQIQVLSEEEAWILFTRELGSYIKEVEELAEAVCKECAGLPLGIRVMARSMKGIHNVRTWRNTKEELKETKISKGHEMQEEVFSVLKFSYLHLNDPALRECLSYCALLPEDSKIYKHDLIEYMIVEGIIDQRRSRQAEFDKSHTILDTLENACLLEGDSKFVRMHDLIRDMVILALREGSKTLVEAGAQLKEIPDVEKWTENLVRVSLIRNDIEVIPSSHTLWCPSLSTLLLCENYALKMIADSFFEQFQSLKILDLSGCKEIEELPKSISDLVNLTAFMLRGCLRLTYVPPIEKLKKLKKLDLKKCMRLKEMPEGVGCLSSLKYLDLSDTGIEEIRSGIIPMLSRLQVLKLCNRNSGHSNFSMKGNEVGELRKLETLHCRFNDVGEFGEYMKSREMSQQSPTDYSFFVWTHNWGFSTTFGSTKIVSVEGDNFIDPLVLPTDIEVLRIGNCSSTLYKRLFPPTLLASLLNLEEIGIGKWDAMEILFPMNEGENVECRAFPFSHYSTRSLSNRPLLNLKRIDIWNCHKLKKLFPPSLLPNLHNLQEISVINCNGMEEIFSTDQEEDLQELVFDQLNITTLHLPRLTTLVLSELRKLRSIYKGAIICRSLQRIDLVRCAALERIPLLLPQPSLQRIKVSPKKWWDAVEWGSANVKKYITSLPGFTTVLYPSLPMIQ